MKRLYNLPLSERLRLYSQAIDLHKQGLGKRKISKLLNVSLGTVGHWLYRGQHPSRRRSKPSKMQKLKTSETLKRLYRTGKRRLAGICLSVKLGIENPMKNPEIRRKVSMALKGQPHPWTSKLNRNPDFARRRLCACIKKPNKAEERLISIIESNSLPFRYVGDGGLVVDGYNPDFIHFTKSRVIELFGRYWHQKTDRWYRSENGRVALWRSLGYDCLVVWCDELENSSKLIEKIGQFERCIS